jgi:antitoxin YefM
VVVSSGDGAEGAEGRAKMEIRLLPLHARYVHGIVQYLVIMEAVMQAILYSEARHDLKNVMDNACKNHEPILITRRKGESVVLVSLEDYESIMESEYLLSSPANASRLLQSLEEARSGKRTPMDALGV